MRIIVDVNQVISLDHKFKSPFDPPERGQGFANDPLIDVQLLRHDRRSDRIFQVMKAGDTEAYLFHGLLKPVKIKFKYSLLYGNISGKKLPTAHPISSR